ncbi:MAG: hypothetical protein LBH82_07005 [Bacteroidales bacterium]|jgi:hypothetical protein|nr:hypothetical protein [Bacteroidales bacterium]
MKKQFIFITMITGIFLTGCKEQMQSVISEKTVEDVVSQLVKQHGEHQKESIEKGVKQMASLWNSSDGDDSVFQSFCMENYIGDPAVKQQVFHRLCKQFETINGGFNKMTVSLMEPIHMVEYSPLPVDEMFGAWSPSAHWEEDFFTNKTAFYVMLNFPFYSLEEKNTFGISWDSQQWGYARMGDIFTSRVPAEISQRIASIEAVTDNYIGNYNICMGKLIDENNNTFFPQEMKLITHWGLRDELKSQYSDKEAGLVKQRMIYEVMKRIIYQEIPQEVINNDEYAWNPYKNEIYKNGKKTDHHPEPLTRYAHLLNTFKAMEAEDAYTPMYPTYISRKFDQEFELSQKEVEQLFITLLESEQVKQVGELISERLGRKLEAFDIWYDGFKTRSSIDPVLLDSMTLAKYPDKESFELDLPHILMKLGFPQEKAHFICSRVRVDASRGAGHAWEASMREDKARLRTRIGEQGMDYKGYNIGTHEFGHNVEQTITLHDVPNYMLAGVPNTAFTEALAFVFQKKDLELLGIFAKNENTENLMALDIFWGCYEIMGVSLVDMRIWKWLYEHPNATNEQVKEKTIEIAKDVWNTYFYPVFGTKDEPVLAVYSHMIASPLYLSAYPLGHLIEFQLEEYFSGKNVGEETMRIFSNGRLVPQIWLERGLGTTLSVEPLLKATTKAINALQK